LLTAWFLMSQLERQNDRPYSIRFLMVVKIVRMKFFLNLKYNKMCRFWRRSTLQKT
jgi:hypothetical protein